MNKILFLDWGIPCLQSSNLKQTSVSLVLRATTVALGAMVLVAVGLLWLEFPLSFLKQLDPRVIESAGVSALLLTLVASLMRGAVLQEEVESLQATCTTPTPLPKTTTRATKLTSHSVLSKPLENPTLEVLRIEKQGRLLAFHASGSKFMTCEVEAKKGGKPVSYIKHYDVESGKVEREIVLSDDDFPLSAICWTDALDPIVGDENGCIQILKKEDEKDKRVIIAEGSNSPGITHLKVVNGTLIAGFDSGHCLLLSLRDLKYYGLKESNGKILSFHAFQNTHYSFHESQSEILLVNQTLKKTYSIKISNFQAMHVVDQYLIIGGSQCPSIYIYNLTSLDESRAFCPLIIRPLTDLKIFSILATPSRVLWSYEKSDEIHQYDLNTSLFDTFEEGSEASQITQLAVSEHFLFSEHQREGVKFIKIWDLKSRACLYELKKEDVDYKLCGTSNGYWVYEEASQNASLAPKRVISKIIKN